MLLKETWRLQLRRELKDFDPKLLAEECMFEEDDPESELEATHSFLFESILEEDLWKERITGLNR